MSVSSPANELASAGESVLVALARTGDRPAFAELVKRRQTTIRHLLRRLSRDQALADDLAQETFLQAWRQLNGLHSIGAFGGWLRQIAVNIWLQHLRRDKQFDALDDTAEPVSAAIYDSEQLDLLAALVQLQPITRLCIVLSYHEGMSHGEVAAATQLPLGTVKSHIVRGTARLRELLSVYACAVNE